jgi:F-type H+-transporting ATPase subunit a
MNYPILRIMFFFLLFAIQAGASEAPAEGAKFDNKYIEHHLSNSDIWHPFPFMDVSFGATLFKIGPIEIKLSLHLLMMIVAFLFLVFSMVFLLKKRADQPPKGFSAFVEILVLFVRDELCKPHLGEKDTAKYLPFFLTLFFFILSLNVLGLIPIFAPATANINITGGFATITLGAMVLGGLKRHGATGFIKLFMPPGVPKVMYVILLPLELTGLFTKPLALTMRLFGNMLGGHIALSAIVSLIVAFGFLGLPALAMGLLIDLIEILSVFLQAMIFTMLSAMFIGSMLHNNH